MTKTDTARGGARRGSVVGDEHGRGSSTNNKDRPDKEYCRKLAAKYDRTDGSKFGHYTREEVAAANHATESQKHG